MKIRALDQTAVERLKEKVRQWENGAVHKRAQLSIERLDHSVREVIAQAYLNKGHKAPSSIKHHSAFCISTSGRALRGVSLVDLHCLPFSYSTDFLAFFIATP